MSQNKSTDPLTSGAIDVAGALTLLGDNHALYAQIAHAFLEEIQKLPQRLAPLLRATDLSEAARVLHTSKGLALTVGAIQLGESCQAGELEIKAALQASRPLAPQVLDRICAQIRASVAATTHTMGSVLAGLSPVQDGSDNANGSAGENNRAAKLLADLNQLEALLKQSDMRAVDAHKMMLRLHGAAVQGRLDALNAAMDAFDFERGVVQCSALIRAFSGPKT